MSFGNGWDVTRIDPVISGGPYISSAQYECDVNNLAGPDNLLVLDDGRLLIGEDTNKHESNMVWLWGEKSEPLEAAGSITVNSIQLRNSSSSNASTWDYQVEVDELQTGLTYTALIVIKELETEEWKGIWWWNDIEENGEQYEHTFSLEIGCYSILASLYESTDLSTDVKNATVLSDSEVPFTVGSGTCVDGVYSNEVVDSQEDENDRNEDSVPGFGVLLSMVALLGAALFTTREK
jgi:PGF-CTERM protein